MMISFWHILFPWVLWKGSTEGQGIYLTFDDGPHPVYTPRLLDLLNRYNAKASFFLLGEKILLYPGIVERIKKEGHTIGNHGFSHQSMIFWKRGKIIREILQTDYAIEKITGKRPLFFRPPYGKFDLRFKKLMDELHHKLVIWSLLSYDFKETNPERLIKKVLEKIHRGAIVLFHDGHSNTPVMLEALPTILNSFHHLGYQMKTLEQIIRGE